MTSKTILFFALILNACTTNTNKNISLTEVELNSVRRLADLETEKGEDFHKADSLNNIVLNVDSSNYNVWKNKAIIDVHKKKYSSAIISINKAINFSPNAYAYYIKGKIYDEMNLTDSAIFYFKKAFDIDSNPTYITAASEDLNKIGKYEEALQLIELGIQKNPKVLKMFAYKATYLVSLGMFENAIENYNLAEKEYKSDELYSGRAIAYTNLDKMEEALSDLNTAISINPNDARYYDWRGLVKNNLYDVNGAFEDFKKSADMGDVEGKEHLDKIQKKLKRFQGS